MEDDQKELFERLLISIEDSKGVMITLSRRTQKLEQCNKELAKLLKKVSK